MAALTSILAAASTALGVAGQVKAAKDRKKDRAEAQARADQAKVEAREAAKLKGSAAPEARVKIGADTPNGTGGTSSTKGRSGRNSTTGVGGFAVSASQIGGL